MTNDQEKQLKELFETELKKQYNNGLKIGVLTISKVILDKLNDSSKPFMKRIEDVKRFCETPWNKQKEIEQESSISTDSVDSDENMVENGENSD